MPPSRCYGCDYHRDVQDDSIVIGRSTHTFDRTSSRSDDLSPHSLYHISRRIWLNTLDPSSQPTS